MGFQVGDHIYDKAYGVGVVKKIDEGNKDFPYYVEFKDGTKIWYKAKEAVPASEKENG